MIEKKTLENEGPKTKQEKVEITIKEF